MILKKKCKQFIHENPLDKFSIIGKQALRNDLETCDLLILFLFRFSIIAFIFARHLRQGWLEKLNEIRKKWDNSPSQFFFCGEDPSLSSHFECSFTLTLVHRKALKI